MSNSPADEIKDSAANPKRTAVDGTEVEQHPLPDQIAVNRYLASKKVSKLKGLAASSASSFHLARHNNSSFPPIRMGVVSRRFH